MRIAPPVALCLSSANCHGEARLSNPSVAALRRTHNSTVTSGSFETWTTLGGLDKILSGKPL